MINQNVRTWKRFLIFKHSRSLSFHRTCVPSCPLGWTLPTFWFAHREGLEPPSYWLTASRFTNYSTTDAKKRIQVWSLIPTHPDSISTIILYVSENDLISVLPTTGTWTIPNRTLRAAYYASLNPTQHKSLTKCVQWLQETLRFHFLHCWPSWIWTNQRRVMTQHLLFQYSSQYVPF